MAGYLGSVPVPQATQHRETFTATAAQTSFATAGYTPQFVDVYLNGVHLSPADVTATNGSDVVLTACLVNDIVDVVSYTPFEVANQTFTGTTTMDVVAIGGATTIATDKKLIFRDSAIHISSTADGDLSIAADDEIDITSTLIDINGAVDMSSTLATASTITVTTGASTKAGSFVGNGIEIKHPTGASNLSIGTQTGNDVKIACIGAQSMRFDTNGAARLTIASDGNVGIGITPSPLTASGGTANLQLGGTFVTHFDIDGKGTSVVANNKFFDGNNNKALFAGESSDHLQFSGIHTFRTGASVSAGATATLTERFRIALNGDLTATDTSIASNSDERLKENVSDYTYDIAKFKQYAPKTFDWKNADAHNGRTGNRGFLAQAVNAIDSNWIGEATVSEDSPDYDIISNNVSLTSKLGDKDAMYISVIQQLITRIEALEG